MIAASIMTGRALAPIEVAIANWRSLTAARLSMQRLSTVLAQVPSSRSSVALPKPTRSLAVEHIAVVAPNGKNLIVADVHFQLVAGEVLAGRTVWCAMALPRARRPAEDPATSR